MNAPFSSPFHGLLNEYATAEFLGVSVRTLQAWRYRGGGPDFMKLGNAVRYSPSAVEAWAGERTRASTSDPGPEAA